MMKKQSITCSSANQTYEMTYWEWGDSNNNKILLCLHGLTRNGRDFDQLATILQDDYRLICPDIVGRGQSDWLTEEKDYNYQTYIVAILTLLNHLNIQKVDCLGTSMGGIIGMSIAANFPAIIQRLILNDVGAMIPKEALQGIAKYILIGDRLLPDFAAVNQHIRRNFRGFGQLSDQQWEQLAKHSVIPLPDGKYRLNYDPKIGHVFQDKPLSDLEDIHLWDIWQKLTCPLLLLHGNDSDLLLTETIEEMQKQQPNMEVIHLENVGHAPALMEEEQIKLIKQWLSQSSQIINNK
jgi:pimeloyl-ACP methyl ester carboxylesterase